VAEERNLMVSENIFYRILTILLFLTVIAVYGGINYYIGKRIWSGSFRHVSFINNKLFWVVYWVIVMSYIAAALLRKYPSGIVSLLEMVGAVWMGMLFYLFIMFLFIDIVRLVLRKINIVVIQNMFNSSRVQIALSLILGLIVFGFLATGLRAAIQSKVSTYNLNLDKTLSSGNLKIVMVSDIHIGSIVEEKRVKKLVAEINELKPDVVLMSGDIIDSSIEPFIKYNIKDIFKEIKSTYGVYAALGNHEGFGDSIDKIVKAYEEAGLKVLRDELVMINESVYIGGRIDVSMARAQRINRKPLAEMLEGADKSKVIIMMDHQPVEFDKAKDAGVDIMVSGHTHRGQLAPANIITSRMFELDYGYLKKGSLNIIVSSGYGTWGPPMRVGSQSEIVEINLKGENK
jgi:predicted MPP superfamily phosphohydrolase